MVDTDGQDKASPQKRFKLLRKMASSFLRLNIANKMRLAVFPLLVLVLVISSFALTKLNQLTSLNEAVLKIDIPIQEAAQHMQELTIDQESIIRRFMILQDDEFLRVFNDRSSEFLKTLNNIKLLQTDLELPLDELEKTYTDYSSFLLTGIELKGKSTKKAYYLLYL